MMEKRELKYILKCNKYYSFWEDHGQPYDEKSAADCDKNNLKTAFPYWNWKVVERETVIRERDLD